MDQLEKIIRKIAVDESIKTLDNHSVATRSWVMRQIADNNERQREKKLEERIISLEAQVRKLFALSGSEPKPKNKNFITPEEKDVADKFLKETWCIVNRIRCRALGNAPMSDALKAYIEKELKKGNPENDTTQMPNMLSLSESHQDPRISKYGQ